MSMEAFDDGSRPAMDLDELAAIFNGLSTHDVHASSWMRSTGPALPSPLTAG